MGIGGTATRRPNQNLKSLMGVVHLLMAQDGMSWKCATVLACLMWPALRDDINVGRGFDRIQLGL